MVSKAAYFRFHKYLGLIGAAFLLVQSLTGLTLVFRSRTAQLLDPGGMISSPGNVDASPGKLLAAAEPLYPGFHVDRLVYPERADGTYIVYLANAKGDKRYVSLARHSAAVLRSGQIWKFPVIAADQIHYEWLFGIPGTVLICIVGVVLLLTVTMGICFWWPRPGRVRKNLTVQWHLAPRAVLRQLHRTIGVTASAFVTFMAITGLFVAVPIVVDGPAHPWSTTESFVPKIEPALRLAESRFPGKAIRDVRMQAPSRIAVFLYAPERNAMAVHRVVIDSHGPSVVSVRNAFDDHEPWVVALPLHDGQDFGLAGEIVVALVGLFLATLATTGPIMWFQARRARRRTGRAPARAASKQRLKAEVGSSL
jgi:uncharacterized iron-regulated membrane protein